MLAGWLIVIAAQPLSERVSATGLLWLVAGGLAYTLGVVFFALDSRLRYGHFIWHLFVIAPPVTTCCGNTAPSARMLTVRPSSQVRPLTVVAGAPV